MEPKEQFKRLAERAGYNTIESAYGVEWVDPKTGDTGFIPGISGTLSDSDVATVLSWLAKAGYIVKVVLGSRYKVYTHANGALLGNSEYADTLPESLYLAVMQLDLESEVAG